MVGREAEGFSSRVGCLTRGQPGRTFGESAFYDEPPPYLANSRCEGWVTLARQSAPEIYQRRHDVSLRIVDGKQPYLNMGNRSSLLAKQFGPQ